jgi:hypothetical protein
MRGEQPLTGFNIFEIGLSLIREIVLYLGNSLDAAIF